MKSQNFTINNIPTVLRGDNGKKVFIAVHGNMSNKNDVVITMLADVANKKGFDTISFDLPHHGDRINEDAKLLNPMHCTKELSEVLAFVKNKYEEVCLFACSIGAYFSLFTFKDENLKKCLFLSPIVDMKFLIDNLMLYSGVTEEILNEKEVIPTNFGETLYSDYYAYVKSHPIKKWDKETHILYGEKDNLQSESVIRNFSEKFGSSLTIFERGEHFFHTDSQLKFYKEWLENNI